MRPMACMRSMAFLAALIVMLLSGCQKTDSPVTSATPAASESTAGESASAATPAPETATSPPGAATPNERRVAAEGEMCGGFAGVACQEGLQCAMEAGRCNVADDAGTCRRAPDVCTQQYDPVCGCDKKTYGNACTAAQAGIKVDKSGECTARVEAEGNASSAAG